MSSSHAPNPDRGHHKHPEADMLTAPGGVHLKVTGLTLRFGGVTAVKDLSLDVEAGSMTGIIGPNGAGKSSFFNCLSGAYRPNAGTIALDAVDITGKPPHQRSALGLARTFQNLAVYPDLTVLENLLMGSQVQMPRSLLAAGLRLPHLRRRERELADRAVIIAESLGVASYFDQPVTKLPYGMQKRLDIGRILLRQPRLVLLDEPMVGMSATEKQDMVTHIRELHAQLRPTILIVEHDVEVVMGLAQQVLVMNFGERLTFGEPEAVRADPRVIEAYLGTAGL